MNRAEAWKVDIGKINRGYGHLPAELVNEWASDQANISKNYKKGLTSGVSSTEEGRTRKQAVLKRIEEALETRSNFTKQEKENRLKDLDNRLEDPALLTNFEYFDIPSSDFMLQFYFALWDRRIAEVMDFLHNYGKDLKGIHRKVPEDDIWYHMSLFEGMNIDKRKQAQDVVDFMNHYHITKATSFGGGHIPERFYGLPSDLNLTVFDNGPVSSLEELFPDENERCRINYIREPLSAAPTHQELLNTQELVWMHGVSMYLNEDNYELTGAILCGASLLQADGIMKYDYLIFNESFNRALNTQGWPNDPRRPMVVFNHPEEAIIQARKTIGAVNAKLADTAYMDIKDINVNVLEPWGATSVYLSVQKHA